MGSRARGPGDAGGAPARRAEPPLLRGLVLTFVFSFVNLAGLFISIKFLGGLGEWTIWQFVGLAGLAEAGLGVAFIVGPNIWRLPVAEAQTSDRTSIRLALDVVLVPRWAALAKVAAGAVMLGAAASREGVSAETAGVLVVAVGIAAGSLALSLIAARFGVARPDLDVVWVVLRRPLRGERELPGLSLSGTFMQLIANIGVIPAVKLLPPSVLYDSGVAPAGWLVAWTVVVAGLFASLAWVAWRGRISWRAPVEQRSEARADLAR